MIADVAWGRPQRSRSEASQQVSDNKSGEQLSGLAQLLTCSSARLLT
jgi:hypothetical protein